MSFPLDRFNLSSNTTKSLFKTSTYNLLISENLSIKSPKPSQNYLAVFLAWTSISPPNVAISWILRGPYSIYASITFKVKVS